MAGALRRVLVTLVVYLMLGSIGCRGGRTDTFAGQVATGEQRYAEACLPCHQGARGIGPALSDKVLASYGSAASLFNYLRTTMPYGTPGILEDDAYWSIVAFLIDSLGIAALENALDARNADRVILEPAGS